MEGIYSRERVGNPLGLLDKYRHSKLNQFLGPKGFLGGTIRPEKGNQGVPTWLVIPVLGQEGLEKPKKVSLGRFWIGLPGGFKQGLGVFQDLFPPFWISHRDFGAGKSQC